MVGTVKAEFRLPEYARDQKLTEMEGCHKNDIERPVDLQDSKQTGNTYRPDGVPPNKSDYGLEKEEEEERRQNRAAHNNLGPFPFGKARCVDIHCLTDRRGSPPQSYGF